MKCYLIANAIYLPLSNGMYMPGSISGHLFLSDIMTEQQVLDKHKDDPKFKTCNDLHDIVNKWGKKIP